MLRPATSIDFTTAVLDPRVTFTRSGATATRINASGFVESVAADTARFDFNPVTLACRGLLIEEARQNLFARSNSFDAAYWTGVIADMTAVANSAISPDGTNNAYKFIPNTNNVNHFQPQSIAVTSGVVYTMSVFAKAAELNQFQMYMTTGFSAAPTATFNLTTGAVTQPSGNSSSATITPFGNGWYRCSITATASSTTTGAFRLLRPLSTAGATPFAGNGVDGIHFYGAQLEIGFEPTSYIPTTTAAVTRNADVATITGTAFSGFWRSGPGSILVRALPSTVSGTRPLVQVDDATADNIIALRGNTTNPELYIREGGSDQATIDAGTISAAAYRLAGAWKAGNGVATLNGFAPVKGTPASIPAATQMRLGSDGTNYLNGHLQSLEYWDEFLTPATLQSVTTSAGYRSIIGPVMRDAIIA